MILVTGATGFLGSVLVRQLVQQNIPVRCTLRSQSVVPKILVPFQNLIDWQQADVLDDDALALAFDGVKQVYHCAAWVSFKEADKELMIKTNVNGTANVVNLCLEYGARLVHASSIAAIGQAKPGKLITEKDYLEETVSNNNYAVSKLESEMEVWRGIAEGLDAVIVNPSLIIGPEAGVNGSGKMFETVRKGLKYYTQGSCGIIDVEDVAHCMTLLMNSNISAERFIINAENWNYKDLFRVIAQHLGVKPPITEAKPWMLELAWRGAALAASLTGTPPSLDKTVARSATQLLKYDNHKIREAIGISFKPVEKSIQEVCNTLMSNKS